MHTRDNTSCAHLLHFGTRYTRELKARARKFRMYSILSKNLGLVGIKVQGFTKCGNKWCFYIFSESQRQNGCHSLAPWACERSFWAFGVFWDKTGILSKGRVAQSAKTGEVLKTRQNDALTNEYFLRAPPPQLETRHPRAPKARAGKNLDFCTWNSKKIPEIRPSWAKSGD